jgi:hypothetical protein
MQKSGRAATAAAALLHTKEGVLMMAVRRRVVVRVAKRINVVLHVLIIIVLLCNGSVQESGLLWHIHVMMIDSPCISSHPQKT